MPTSLASGEPYAAVATKHGDTVVNVIAVVVTSVVAISPSTPQLTAWMPM